MGKRDEFKAETKRTLAARAGYHCSNPQCVRSTSGAALAADAAVSIGVAAHIAGAASGRGSVRYDPTMSSEERRSINNGIWLCHDCSDLIDKDTDRYTVLLLKGWKAGAEKKSADALAGGRPLGSVRPDDDLDDADEEFLKGLGLPSADAVDAVAARLREASSRDVETFRAEVGRPTRTVPLTLHLRGSGAFNCTLESLARLPALAEPVYVLGPGGIGKSTTLIQVAESSLTDDGPVPLFVPLGAWSDREDDFFDLCLRRNAFGAFRRQHLMQLAHFGKLTLLLDGWNEIDPEARLRATRDLGALRREYPQMGIVITTRAQSLPVDGRIVDVAALSQDQQIALATALRGEAGVDLIDRAWRTSGVRDLVSIPLYLNALLALPAGASFPETKEEVLRMFVQQNESAPDRAERLNQELLGHHVTFLESLATEANKQANGVFSDSEANRVVSSALDSLIEDGQIGHSAPHPPEIIRGLTDAHLLVGSGGTVRFQHQLFQEWYAAADVEKLMSRSAAGDSAARKRLREEILNWSSWEESILFACDRLSRSGEAGANAVAMAIDLALGIDPVLAATMLDRAADTVWASMRERVLRFVARWHTPGTFDRAVRFMVASGKPEFADLVWPLAANADHEIQFDTFRAADRFRPGVLGPDRAARLRTLPAQERKIALVEIASNSGFDGMELATSLAVDDPDPDVVADVVAALDFRRGSRQINRIMRLAPDPVWNAVAGKSYPEHFTDQALDARLATARSAAPNAEAQPVRLLNHLLREKPADAEARITALLQIPSLEFGEQHLTHAVALAHKEYPSAVAAALVARLLADLPLPFRASTYLKDAPRVDVGRLAEIALDPCTQAFRRNAAAAVVGPMTVSGLFDQLFAHDDLVQAGRRYDQSLSEERTRLESAIAATRQDVFVEVLVAKADTDNPRRIGVMAHLLARHGREGVDSAPRVEDPQRTSVRLVVEAWMAALLRALEPARHVSANVAGAAGRLADASLAEPLRRLLERDLADQAAARTARLAAPRRTDGPDATGYSRIYAQALTAMRAVTVLKSGLSDLRWGIDAAAALYEIWSAGHLPTTGAFERWAGVGEHLSHRAGRSAGEVPTSESAEAIFAVVRAYGNATNTDQEQRHAIALAATGLGLGLAHGNKRSEIDTLLALPQPIEAKQRLLLCMARSGEIVPSAPLMDGVRNLLKAAQTEPWRLGENSGELKGWLELFPFSDDPTRVHEAIALVPERHRRDALRRLLEVLPQSPAPSALAMLERLATGDPALLQDSAWRNALVRLDTEEAAMVALDRYCAGAIPIRNGFQFSRALTAWVRKYPSVRSAMIARYRTSPRGDIQAALEMAMADLADEEVFWALFDNQVESPRSIGGLVNAIRNLAVGQKPSEEWKDAHEEFGLPLTQLRARLFGMLPAGDERARLAKTCLIAIEKHRDENGRVLDEPRHPDIATGRQWPPEAEESGR